ncbi:MAG: amidohydrolase family protein [Acidobacteria bacterium]|nr:amidohydrolase family protein [Acidobacteriota bacterium]
MKISEIPAIDVHAHYGIYLRKGLPLLNRFMTGSAEKVVERARQSGIESTVVSPLLGLLPRFEADAVAGNQEAARVVEETPGLLQWVIVNPKQEETFSQAADRLQHPRCMGIKIHPEEHGYPIAKEGARIFEFAARHSAVVLTHSGEQNSLPEDCVPFANALPEMKLILAHLGCGWDFDQGHQVRAIQASRNGNVYVDTSSMLSIYSGLVEWAVEEIGSTHILFGTDSPLYSAAAQRRRIEAAEISDADKRAILRDNAVALLKLPPR